MSHSQLKTVYLAGPEVFMTPALNKSVVEAKKSILESLGMVGVDLLDNQLDFPEGLTGPEKAFIIYEANKKAMDECDACIANLTPFRGPSADAGTVFEVGYMISQAKPVFGFTVISGSYGDRFSKDYDRDAGNLEIERFDLCDNLMIECGIVNNGGFVARGQKTFDSQGLCGNQGLYETEFFDEAAFRKCAEALRAKFDSRLDLFNALVDKESAGKKI